MRKHKNNTGDFRKQRLRVLRRDGGICVYCGADATCVDHVVPMVRGGGDEMDNLVASCTLCNLRKGSKSVFLAGANAPLVFSGVPSAHMTTTIPNGPFTAQSEQNQAM